MIADSSGPGVGDELVTRIVPLENVPARDLAPLLRQMMDAGSVGNVVHYEPSNVLILTGRASTINKLIEVIKRVDVIGTETVSYTHLPERQIGLLIEPERARPVPFWRHGFLPEPVTSARVF